MTVAYRTARERSNQLCYRRLPEDWRKEAKLDWLAQVESTAGVEWQELPRHTWVQIDGEEYASFVACGLKIAGPKISDPEAVFRDYSIGVSTNRDAIVYDFRKESLLSRVEGFCDDYNGEVDRYRRRGKPEGLDDFVDYSTVKWSETLKNHLKRGDSAEFDPIHVRVAFYRPFTKRYLYYDTTLNDRPGFFCEVFPTEDSEFGNAVICFTSHTQIPFSAQTTKRIPDAATGGRAGQCFPFYTYDEDGTNRRENITDWGLEHFREHYGDSEISKWEIFHYVYGVLHHPGYREKFADNLKRELPRIPLAPDFRAFAKAGKRLAELHVEYELLEPWDLEWIETPGEPLSYVVEKMRLAKDKKSIEVNDSLTLAGIPPEVFDYRLGNRSAIEWVIDQYRVKEDKRTGIRSDPNNLDDPEYIVRLVGQVVRVSMETVQIVAALPERYAPEPGAASTVG
ncbi:MAG: helicase [bacterium]|nr:helicase [bacterium]